MEAADVTFLAGKRTVDHAHNLIRLALFRVEGIVRVRTLQHYYLISVILVVVTESAHLRFGYGASGGFLVRCTLAVVADKGIGTVVTKELNQCVLGGKHEHIAIKKRHPLLTVTSAHVHLGMGRTIDFQYVPDLVLFAPNECTQLLFMSGFGTDKEPLVIYVVEFVRQHDGFTIYKVLFTVVNPFYNTAKS